MPVVNENCMPVLYIDWAEWRAERVLTTNRPVVEFGSCFCMTCSGNGHIYEFSPNGEGLIPVPCVTCLGRGTT
jgi:hypothetical protein